MRDKVLSSRLYVKCMCVHDRGWRRVNVTCFAKEKTRRAESTATRLRRPCHDYDHDGRPGFESDGLTPSLRGTGVDGVLQSGRSVHVANPGSPHELMCCSSMRALTEKLPMQELAWNNKYWSVGISYVHWARQFKQFWSRQYMQSYIGLRIIEVHRLDIKYFSSCRDP